MTDLKNLVGPGLNHTRNEIKNAVSADGEQAFEEWYSGLNLPQDLSR